MIKFRYSLPLCFLLLGTAGCNLPQQHQQQSQLPIEENTQTMLLEVSPVPTYSPVCFGTDISGMALDEVAALANQYTTDSLNTNKSIKEIAFEIVATLPDNVKDTLKITDVMLVDDANFTSGASQSGTLFLSVYSKNPILDTYAAIGELVDERCGSLSESNEWEALWEKEHQNEFHTTSDTRTSFSSQFAYYMEDSYGGCWNSIHTPNMYGYVENVWNNFDDMIERNRRIKVQKAEKNRAYESHLQQCDDFNEYYGSDDVARLEHAKSLLPDFLQRFIKEENLVWELHDEVVIEGQRYAGVIFYKTPSSGLEYTTVKILKGYRVMEKTVAHEVGHYVDRFIYSQTGNDIRDAFEQICKDEFEYSLLLYDEFNPDELGEYFADSFALCICPCKEVRDYYKTYCPNTYAYVWDTISSLQEIYETNNAASTERK